MVAEQVDVQKYRMAEGSRQRYCQECGNPAQYEFRRYPYCENHMHKIESERMEFERRVKQLQF